MADKPESNIANLHCTISSISYAQIDCWPKAISWQTMIKDILSSQAQSGSEAKAEPGKSAKVYYKGPLDVARKVLATEGGVTGLYKGLVPTLLREVPGNALMFGSYEYLKRKARQIQVAIHRSLRKLSCQSAHQSCNSPWPHECICKHCIARLTAWATDMSFLTLPSEGPDI